jgi:hypothetical protein
MELPLHGSRSQGNGAEVALPPAAAGNMTNKKRECNRRDLLSVRQRQKQLGRGLRLMYEQVLCEPIPPDMIEALRRAEQHPPGHNSDAGQFPD